MLGNLLDDLDSCIRCTSSICLSNWPRVLACSVLVRVLAESDSALIGSISLVFSFEHSLMKYLKFLLSCAKFSSCSKAVASCSLHTRSKSCVSITLRFRSRSSSSFEISSIVHHVFVPRRIFLMIFSAPAGELLVRLSSSLASFWAIIEHSLAALSRSVSSFLVGYAAMGPDQRDSIAMCSWSAALRSLESAE